MTLPPTPRLVRPPEPLSGHAMQLLRAQTFDTRIFDGYIRTERTARLSYELARYCLRQQEGLSMLITGTRGAGKTTLTRLATQDVIVAYRRGTLPDLLKTKPGPGGGAPLLRPLIPLPILLHGPTLLDIYAVPDWFQPLPDKMEEAAAAISGSDLAAKRWKEMRRNALKERALRAIVNTLHTHLRDTILSAWDNWIHGTVPVGPERDELAELGAQLELLLDSAPDPDTLRRFWHRAGVLRSGVLPYLYPNPRATAPQPDQGLREIQALAACAMSFRSILGKVKQSQTMNRTRKSEREQTIGLERKPPADPKPKEDSKPKPSGTTALRSAVALAPMLVTVAASPFHAEWGPWSIVGTTLGGAVLSQLGLIVSGFTFKLGENTRRTTDRSDAIDIDVDWTAQRLERELPKLIQRVKEAGLAPIFIIDELDKLENPFDELQDFLHVSKNIVRDQAAFLFLANRDYAADLREQPKDLPNQENSKGEDQPRNPNPLRDEGFRVASTFFEHQLNLFYAPSDFRKYIINIFYAVNAGGASVTPANEAGPILLPLPAMVLASIIAYRARLQPFLFNRELNFLLNEEGNFRNDLLSNKNILDQPIMRFHFLMAVVIEEVSWLGSVDDKADREPWVAQLMFDALFLIPRRIEAQGTTIFETKGKSLTVDDLRSDLSQRLNEGRTKDASAKLDDDLCGWLFNLVRQQSEILANPLLLERVAERGPKLRPSSNPQRDNDKQMFARFRAEAAKFAPVMKLTGEDDTKMEYEMLVDAYGRERSWLELAYQSEIKIEKRHNFLLQDFLKFVQSLGKLLEGFDGIRLCETMHLLPNSPPFRSVLLDVKTRLSDLRTSAPSASDQGARTRAIADNVRDMSNYIIELIRHRHAFDRAMRVTSVIALSKSGVTRATLAQERTEVVKFLKDKLLGAASDVRTRDQQLQTMLADRSAWHGTRYQELLERPPGMDTATVGEWADYLMKIASRAEELV